MACYYYGMDAWLVKQAGLYSGMVFCISFQHQVIP